MWDYVQPKCLACHALSWSAWQSVQHEELRKAKFRCKPGSTFITSVYRMPYSHEILILDPKTHHTMVLGHKIEF